MNEIQNTLLNNQQRLALYGSSCLWKVQLRIQQSKPKIILICNQKFVREITQRSLVSYTTSYLRSMVCKYLEPFCVVHTKTTPLGSRNKINKDIKSNFVHNFIEAFRQTVSMQTLFFSIKP